MKDLTNFLNPLDFEVRESCDFNDGFVEHIPYAKKYGDYTTEEYLNDAVKEMILRRATQDDNKDICAQFTDYGIPGAQRIIIDTVKNAVNIIAAILFKFDISNYYEKLPEEARNVFRTNFIDKISISRACIYTSYDKCYTLEMDVCYFKMSKDQNKDPFIKPIVVKCNVPLTDIVDRLRNKTLYEAGDAVYTIIYSGVPIASADDVKNTDPDLIPKASHYIVESNDLIKSSFDDVVGFIYQIVFNNNKKKCQYCERNKFENIECLNNLPVDDMESVYRKLTDENLFSYDGANKSFFEMTLNKKDIGGFNRFTNISRRIVEYDLAIDDYINTPVHENDEEK